MIKNPQFGKYVLSSIDILNQATTELCKAIQNNDSEAIQLSKNLFVILMQMDDILYQLYAEEPALMAHLICRNAVYSLENIMVTAPAKPQEACKKIEFELLPLIQELYVDLYFWGFCYPDKEKMWHYYLHEMDELCPLPYVDEAEKTGSYKYEVSIVVVAYNKLEYTKKCIEYLLNFLPKDLSYELILVNNGSNDGTKEFFESIHPDKQIDILHNTKSFSVVSRIIEGKYILFISNDVLIMPHSIENMITCIKSDEKIGCVVPTCPNIYCLQSIPANYTNENELLLFSEKNNISDPYRWEQRVRITPPVSLARSKIPEFYSFFSYQYPYTMDRFLSFSDDLMSMLLRRRGYKNILAKDAYVYHYGSVTVSQEVDESNHHLKGREVFIRTFGIDPWEDGVCYDWDLIHALPLSEKGPVNVLGINCGMGGDPLKIKESLKENCYNLSVKVYNTTNNPNHCEDLKSVSDAFKFMQDPKTISKLFPDTFFKYIIIKGNFTAHEDAFQIINQAFFLLTPDGIMAVKNSDSNFQNNLKNSFREVKQAGAWSFVKKD